MTDSLYSTEDDFASFDSQKNVSHSFGSRLVPAFLVRLVSSKKTREKKWINYYANLYQKKAPDKKEFSFLLARYGFWDFKAPFKEGSDDFYHFHEENVFLADIDFLLSRWKSRFDEPAVRAVSSSLSPAKQDQSIQDQPKQDQLEAIEGLVGIIQSGWESLYAHRPADNPFKSVYETEKERVLLHQEKDKEWESVAVSCLVYLFLSHKKQWILIKNYLHKDNMRILVHIIFQKELKRETKKILLNQFFDANFITDTEKKWLEEQFITKNNQPQ